MALDDLLAEYDFPLDESRIAKFPAKNRDESKLLGVDRATNQIREYSTFKEIKSLLKPGDLLVFNQTKVSKRRVYLKTKSGRVHESVFIESRDPLACEWVCILKNRKKLKLGDLLFPETANDISFTFLGGEGDLSILRSIRGIGEEDFERWGNVPIPPYLKRKATNEDNDRYQTIFAKDPGSVAAPTAGLHFTHELQNQLIQSGIEFVPVNLRIGYGTFQPFTEEQFQAKKLHEESFSVPQTSADAMNQARAEGRRIIAVGTTTLRVLESIFEKDSQKFMSGDGITDIFMSPGYSIQSIQGLITNFHLPRSSLLLLVSTFAERELVLRSYHYALEQNFRFYSYGDAMFIY